MKFIHIADIHWGMHPDNDKPWARDRAQSIKDTFAEVIHQSKTREADCLLIAGDLFHHQPLLRDLKELNYLFSTIPATRVIIIAGNHDRIRANSALLSFQWCPNVTFLMGEEPQTVVFPELNFDVTGFSYHTAEITEPRLNSIRTPANQRIHILLAHGGDEKHVPIEKNLLSTNGFTYTALGHIHKPELSPDRRWAYPGSLEPLDRTETGQHGMIVGEINPHTHQVTALEFVPLCQAQYISLVAHVTPTTTNAELIDRISTEIRRRGIQHIYRLRLVGQRDPDILFELDSLEHRMQIIEIVDESEPQYNFSQLFAEHPSDMIGFYIRAFQHEDLTPVEKKALFYGIDALLCTTDERS
jgi:DNA repair exonuclease SbcCD nuclease subunit